MGGLHITLPMRSDAQDRSIDYLHQDEGVDAELTHVAALSIESAPLPPIAERFARNSRDWQQLIEMWVIQFVQQHRLMQEPHLGANSIVTCRCLDILCSPVFHVSPARRAGGALRGRISPNCHIAPESTCLGFGIATPTHRFKARPILRARFGRKENTFNPLCFASRVTSDRWWRRSVGFTSLSELDHRPQQWRSCQPQE
jgi:hypothetical protein